MSAEDRAMALSWSHIVIFVQDTDKMLDFYTRVLGFQVTDRGEIPDRGYEIIFMSQQADEHHQIGLANSREKVEPSNSVAHTAFRVPGLADLRKTIEGLKTEGVDMRPTSHGNTWSIYFQDPEMNGVEIFTDSPWQVKQPQGKVWDMELDDASLLAWTEETFKTEPRFEMKSDFVARRVKELADS
jgi:catechol 2,3-dioxygenase